MTKNVFERIEKFNQGRNPQRLGLKYQAMRKNSFVFFRGTCHLFYEDWPAKSPLNDAPSTWICGDLHLENFGSYKGDNRLVYFDMNDFDEAILAPCTWEIARLLTSVIVGAGTLGVNQQEALALCHCFLDAYINALATGKARYVETETAKGMVKDLLVSLKERKRADFLNKTTEVKKGKRQFVIDNKHIAEITTEERSQVESFLSNWATTQTNPEFFKLLDVAVRIAGTGSLGIRRYVLLVTGKGSPDQNYLIDVKQAIPSSLQPYVKISQPKWNSEAERVVSIQQRVQATPKAMLSPVLIDSVPFVLSGLQPSQDRVSLDLWNGKLRRLERVLETMGEITAWAQLRSGGRQKSAIADELIAFSQDADWRSPLLDYAQSYAQQVTEDYQEFCATSAQKMLVSAQS